MRCASRRHRGIFPRRRRGSDENVATCGAEQLLLGNRLWSATEVPGRRMLFWVYTSEMQ